MSVRVMNWVFESSQTTHAADRLVLLTIADRATDEGTDAWPSIDTLARKTRLSRFTIMRAIARLEALGELRVERTEGAVNRYTILMRPANPSQSATGNQLQSATGDALQSATGSVLPVAPVQRGPVALVQHNTSSTSSTHTPRAREASPSEPPVLPFTRPRRSTSPGPLAGSLPRDFADRAVFGRLVLPQATLTRWALRHSADVEAGRAAVSAWLTAFAASLPPDAAIGDALWLERHFDAWLLEQGRVAPAPASAPPPRAAAAPTGRTVPDAAATRRLMQELLG